MIFSDRTIPLFANNIGVPIQDVAVRGHFGNSIFIVGATPLRINTKLIGEKDYIEVVYREQPKQNESK